MGAQYYLLAWGVYWLAAMGCLVVWYRMTRSIGTRALKILLRAGAWILLCTPWPQSGENGPLSPAFLTMLFDGLTFGPEAMLRTLPVLLGLVVLLLVLLLVDAVVGAGKGERQPPSPS